MILNQFLPTSGLCIDFHTWHPILFLLSLFSVAKYLRPIIRSSVLPLKGIHHWWHQERHCRLPLNGTIAAYQFWRRQHYTIRQNQLKAILSCGHHLLPSPKRRQLKTVSNHRNLWRIVCLLITCIAPCVILSDKVGSFPMFLPKTISSAVHFITSCIPTGTATERGTRMLLVKTQILLL